MHSLLILAWQLPHCMQAIAAEYGPRLSWLRQFVSHSDSATREAIARLMGIISEGLDGSSLERLLDELLHGAGRYAAGKGGR